jgi:hypothetical protein
LLEAGVWLKGAPGLVTSAWFSLEVVPFITAEPRGVFCCPSVFAIPVEGLWASRRCIDDCVGSLDIDGIKSRPDTGVPSVPCWLLDESPLRKGMRDVRFFSFFGFSADPKAGGAAFFLLPITVPRRLFKPCFLGVSLVSMF